MKTINFILTLGIVYLICSNVNWILQRKIDSAESGLMILGKDENVENSIISKASGEGEKNEIENTKSFSNEPAPSPKNKFYVKIPDGWQESEQVPGIEALVKNISEKIENESAKKIGFKTYFAVNYDLLHGKNLKEHLRYEKNNLLKIAPDIKFVQEKQTEINGKESYVFEAEFSEKTSESVLDYFAAIAIIRDGNDIWSISFNTLKDYHEWYGDLIDEIINSFRIN